MAFPTQVDTYDMFENQIKPYISSGGNVYVIKEASATTIKAYKATDPTSSFSAQTGGPTFTAIGHTTTVQDGDTIHVATYDSTDSLIEYHEFDMSTDIWDTTNETVADISGMDAPGVSSCSIMVRGVSGDELVVSYGGLTDTVMGTAYARIDFNHKDKTASSWTGPVAIDDAGELHYAHSSLALGTSNKVHCIYAQTSSADAHGKTISTSNTLSTVAADTGFDWNAPPKDGMSFDNSGTQDILFTDNDDLFLGEENGSGDFIWQSTSKLSYSDSAGGVVGCLAFQTGTTVYAVFHRSSTIYYDKSTDGGATWGTDTVATGSILFTYLAANIYERNGATVLAYIYDDTTNTQYDEVEIVAAPVGGRRIFIIS